MLVSLAPGSYTVQVSGVGNTSGVAIIEAYEVGTTGGRLVNLSTRAQVGTGNNILIPGIVISPGAGTRRLLIRGVGPTLGTLGVGGTLADPQLIVTNSAGTPAFSATNDNWLTPVGTTAAPGEVLAAAFVQAGAFSFAPTSRDAAVMVDLPPAVTPFKPAVSATPSASASSRSTISPRQLPPWSRSSPLNRRATSRAPIRVNSR